MNIQQLGYVVAVDRFRHFAKAAEHCKVTQPTLSTMINRLEEELGVMLFDRTRSPVIPTATGMHIIAQARRVFEEVDQLHRLAGELSEEVEGVMRIGVIPTVAPFLLPLFLTDLIGKYPGVRVSVKELTTDQIVERLRHNEIDVGILATPLGRDGIKEIPLYEEPFLFYEGRNPAYTTRIDEHAGKEEAFVRVEDIPLERLWLLEEGHCLRGQIQKLCDLKKKQVGNDHLMYEAGSIDSLKRLVDMNQGVTVLPELATREFSKNEKARIKLFHEPVPARQISLAIYRDHLMERMVQVLQSSIQQHVLPLLQKNREVEIIGV